MINFDVDTEVAVLVKYKLTPNELFLIRAMLSAQDGESNYFVQYMSIPESIRGGLREILISLRNKGIITQEYKIPDKGGDFEIEDVSFNKNFIKQIYKASFVMGKELFEHYPQFARINGSLVPIRGVSKKFDSLEAAYMAYGKAIKWNPKIHEEIIELLDWAGDKDIINCALHSFIIDRRWLDLKALKEGDGVNINYDAVKML